MSEQLVFPAVLDACCGPRSMWFDSADRRALFIDKRQGVYFSNHLDGRQTPTRLDVAPDIVADFTKMPFANGSFRVVVFDPPHVNRKLSGHILQRYGVLPNDWEAVLRRGFAECFRVLTAYGLLIFKWAETDFPLADVLALTPVAPLFGHRTGRGARTHWCVFMKEPA